MMRIGIADGPTAPKALATTADEAPLGCDRCTMARSSREVDDSPLPSVCRMFRPVSAVGAIAVLLRPDCRACRRLRGRGFGEDGAGPGSEVSRRLKFAASSTVSNSQTSPLRRTGMTEAVYPESPSQINVLLTGSVLGLVLRWCVVEISAPLLASGRASQLPDLCQDR